jgi:hypothetical protein
LAGDWIKVEKLTPDKPEIAILARKLGVSIGDAFLEWFRIYAWAEPGPEREESERRDLSLNSDRKANGSARAIGPRADHSLSLSRKVFVREAG